MRSKKYMIDLRFIAALAAFDFRSVVVSKVRLFVRCALDSVYDVDEDRGRGARRARFVISVDGIVTNGLHILRMIASLAL